MFRLFAMTFLGKPKDHHVHEHAHESPLWMTIPLIVLAVFSVVAGYDFWHGKLLDPAGASVSDGAGSIHAPRALAWSSWGSRSPPASAGSLLGFVVFGSGDPAKVARWKWKPFRAIEPACAAKFGFDEVYREFLLRPVYLIATFFAFADREGVDGAVNGIGRAGLATSTGSGVVDRVVVDGLVRGTGAAVLAGGDGVARVQSGRLRTYLGVGVALTALALLVVSIVSILSKSST